MSHETNFNCLRKPLFPSLWNSPTCIQTRHIRFRPPCRLAVVQVVAVAWNSYLTWKANKMWRTLTSPACVVLADDYFALIRSVCDMGVTYFRLLSLLVFPMCKAVTESRVKVGRNGSSTPSDKFTHESQTCICRNVCESFLFMEMGFGGGAAVYPHIHTHTLTPIAHKGNFSNLFSVLTSLFL